MFNLSYYIYIYIYIYIICICLYIHYIYIICIYNVKKLPCTLDIYAYVTYKMYLCILQI